MRISSPAFQDGKPIPTRYAHPGVTGGKNISLPVEWTAAPAETRSFALSIVDPHPVANDWVHWLVINIPKTVNSIPEGASGRTVPAGSKELYNTYGTLGYGGPEPPKGSGAHPYEVVLYALSADNLELPAGTSLSAFKKALEGKVIASAKTTGMYER
jgi:Raf kinase inhibitor-like YbhB/YbcL family protein